MLGLRSLENRFALSSRVCGYRECSYALRVCTSSEITKALVAAGVAGVAEMVVAITAGVMRVAAACAMPF